MTDVCNEEYEVHNQLFVQSPRRGSRSNLTLYKFQIGEKFELILS